MKPAIIAFAITVFISLYGALHYYAYRKLAPVLPQHRRLVIVVLVLLGFSVMAVEFFTHGNVNNRYAEPIAFVSFSWMGGVFMFFTLSVAIDIVSWFAGKTGYSHFQRMLDSPRRSIMAAIAVLLLSGYGYIASHEIHIERLSFTLDKVMDPLQIVQITDLHLGLLSDTQYFKQVVDEINALDVDLIVCTGDLVDMQMDHLDGLGEIMSGLRARYGKYAVFGNHEALAGLESSRDFIERIGFTLLSNRGVSIDNVINLVGVDDPAIEGKVQQSSLNEADLLKQFENGLPTVLLKHQPSIEQASLGLFDLQLSGHTHGGQIFPFGLLIHLFYKAPFGLSQIDNHGWLYVSRGTGTWGPPMRILAPPEITLIQLLPKKPA